MRAHREHQCGIQIQAPLACDPLWRREVIAPIARIVKVRELRVIRVHKVWHAVDSRIDDRLRLKGELVWPAGTGPFEELARPVKVRRSPPPISQRSTRGPAPGGPVMPKSRKREVEVV